MKRAHHKHPTDGQPRAATRRTLWAMAHCLQRRDAEGGRERRVVVRLARDAGVLRGLVLGVH